MKSKADFPNTLGALETSLNETSAYNCDIQVEEFVFNKTNMTASVSPSIFFLSWNLWNKIYNWWVPV